MEAKRWIQKIYEEAEALTPEEKPVPETEEDWQMMVGLLLVTVAFVAKLYKLSPIEEK